MKTWKIVLIVVVVLVVIGAVVGGTGSDEETTTTKVAVSTTQRVTTTTASTTTTTRATTTTLPPTTTTTLSADAYRALCEPIEFRVLDKNPDSHLGKYMRFTGEIIQIWEEPGYTVMRTNVTKERYGYTDTILVAYPGTIDVYEDDIIDIWGQCAGSYTYESTIGAQITVASIMAEYVEKRQE